MHKLCICYTFKYTSKSHSPPDYIADSMPQQSIVAVEDPRQHRIHLISCHNVLTYTCAIFPLSIPFSQRAEYHTMLPIWTNFANQALSHCRPADVGDEIAYSEQAFCFMSSIYNHIALHLHHSILLYINLPLHHLSINVKPPTNLSQFQIPNSQTP